MFKHVKMGVAILFLAGSSFVSSVQAEVKSGPAVGERVSPYTVRDVTGPNAGKSLCYRCQYGNAPVVNIFARKVDDNLVGLIKKLDQKMDNNTEIKGFVTILTDDVASVEAKLKEIAEKEGIKHLPLTVFEGSAGPEEYKIAKDADVTVLMWNQSTVKVNKAFEPGELNMEKVSKVVEELPKIKS